MIDDAAVLILWKHMSNIDAGMAAWSAALRK